MIVRLKNVSAIAVAKFLFWLQGGIGFLIGLFHTATVLMDRTGVNPPTPFGAWSVVILPIVYGLTGFLIGFLGVCAYNLMVPRLGGGIPVEFEPIHDNAAKSK